MSQPRTILRFSIDANYDATSYVAYVYAPGDWDTRTPEEREEFLREEGEDWLHEQVSVSVTEYDGKPPSWETGGHPSEPDDWYDAE